VLVVLKVIPTNPMPCTSTSTLPVLGALSGAILMPFV
jgi:hypothetical protein